MKKIKIQSASSVAAALRLLPPETAHDLTLKSLQLGLYKFLPKPAFDCDYSNYRVTLPQLGELPHPIGLAAGFDKSADCCEQLFSLGFSFVEIGTVTPMPQQGNPKPRLFRLPESRSIVNRMGFNNAGVSHVARKMGEVVKASPTLKVGLNVGKNKTTPNHLAIEDYLIGIDQFAPLAKYLVVNISSPNTPDLRDLASREFLQHLAERKPHLKNKVWIKLDPDMSRKRFQGLIEDIADLGFAGLVLSNTHRTTLPESGGLSGHSLSVLSTTMLEWAYHVHEGKLPMIASGGVLSGMDVFQKMIRGASAVQIYAALIYRGPWAVYHLLEELAWELRLRKIDFVSDIVGKYYDPDFS
ncbi:MAG: quinone-dependent dihydroorotate dehydrogenase [Oligoflexales bacterium]